MDSQELRNQAKRWRSRVVGADEETAEALVDAAKSFEGLAQDKDREAAQKKQGEGEFMHRAYDKKDTKDSKKK
jgi:hypothetical protein